MDRIDHIGHRRLVIKLKKSDQNATLNALETIKNDNYIKLEKNLSYDFDIDLMYETINVFEKIFKINNFNVLKLTYLMSIPAFPNNFKVRKLYLSRWVANDVDLINISKIENLEELHLDAIYLRILPNEIKNLKKLNTLVLHNAHDDDFGMSNQSAIYSLITLKKLELSNRHFSILNTDINKLVNLVSLTIKNCKLKALPTLFNGFPNLRLLDLSNNNIESIPESLTDLKNVSNINLSTNRLTYVSPKIYEMKSLEVLNLSYNTSLVVYNNYPNLKIDKSGTSKGSKSFGDTGVPRSFIHAEYIPELKHETTLTLDDSDIE